MTPFMEILNGRQTKQGILFLFIFYFFVLQCSNYKLEDKRKNTTRHSSSSSHQQRVRVTGESLKQPQVPWRSSTSQHPCGSASGAARRAPGLRHLYCKNARPRASVHTCKVLLCLGGQQPLYHWTHFVTAISLGKKKNYEIKHIP